MQSALASAVVALKCLPDKLNPVIRPLMEAAKKEGNAQLQVTGNVREMRKLKLENKKKSLCDHLVVPFGIYMYI